MIYYLQEELFSFDHFDIWDEQDNVCFQVDREFLTWGKTLRVRDAQGRLCATVHHVPFSIPCSFAARSRTPGTFSSSQCSFVAEK